MKHRSPLFTLAAVALAFIIMFTVDVLAGPPGASSAQPVATWAPPAPPAPASASRSTEESTSPQLNPENPEVTVDGDKLDAVPVNGDGEL